ncbi:hypothetical protein UlMin_039194 [Ulmus minor]
MEVAWRPLLLLTIVSALIIHEEWVLAASCTIITDSNLNEFVEEHLEDLKVMMVANLLLMDSNAGYLNILFRDHYMSKFFRKSFQSLDPDMLVVLGDVSAKGSELTKEEMGIRIWGELSSKLVSWIAGRFPGLDSAGCGAFEISNVSFLSLNAIALLCGNNDLGFASKIFLHFLSLSRENFHYYYQFIFENFSPFISFQEEKNYILTLAHKNSSNRLRNTPTPTLTDLLIINPYVCFLGRKIYVALLQKLRVNNYINIFVHKTN